MGDLSTHFSRQEFRDSITGALKGPTPELLWGLETLRNIVGRPLRIISGYRSAKTNKLAGGAPRSRHLVGDAADIPRGYATVQQALDAGFTGIGVRDGWVVHVDRRPVAFPVIFTE